MIVRPYQKVNSFYIPSIKIQFANPDRPQFNAFEYCLLDTGGSVTLVPYFLIYNLSLPRLNERIETAVEGVSQKRMICIPYLLSFSFD